MKFLEFPCVFVDDEFTTDIELLGLNGEKVMTEVIRFINDKPYSVRFHTSLVDLSKFRPKITHDPTGKLKVKLILPDHAAAVAIVKRRNNDEILLTIQPNLLTFKQYGLPFNVTTKFVNNNDYYPSIQFCGSSTCNYLKINYVSLLNLIAASISYDFPDREDLRLAVGDCTPIDGDCPGHPVGSHRGGAKFDINYYTFKTNLTQYRKSREQLITSIWDGNYGWAEKLLTDVFDWERNYEFFIRTKIIFPQASFMSNVNICEHMRKQVLAKHGREKAKEFSRLVNGDINKTWNHHLHSHCSVGNSYNIDTDMFDYKGEFSDNILYPGVPNVKSNDIKYIEETFKSITYVAPIVEETVTEKPEEEEPTIEEPVIEEPVIEETPIIEEPTPVVEETPDVPVPAGPIVKKKKENLFEKVINFFKKIFKRIF